MLENSLDMALRADDDKVSDGVSLLVARRRVRSQRAATAAARASADATRPRTALARERTCSHHPKAPAMDRARFALAGVYTAYGSGANPAVPVVERAAYLERAGRTSTPPSSRQLSPVRSWPSRRTRARRCASLPAQAPDDALDAYQSGSVNARKNAAAVRGAHRRACTSGPAATPRRSTTSPPCSARGSAELRAGRAVLRRRLSGDAAQVRRRARHADLAGRARAFVGVHQRRHRDGVGDRGRVEARSRRRSTTSSPRSRPRWSATQPPW